MMSKKSVILSLLLSVSLITAQDKPQLPPLSVADDFVVFNDPALDKFLNPNEQEEDFVYSIEQPPPPGTLLVWLRIVGVPVLNAFFAVRRVARTTLAWVLAALNIKQPEAAPHEQQS